MELQTAQTELLRRTLHWSTTDLAREVAGDFPILTTYGLNNRYVLGFVHWCRSLDHNEQDEVKRVLPKLGLGTGVYLMGASRKRTNRCTKRFTEGQLLQCRAYRR